MSANTKAPILVLGTKDLCTVSAGTVIYSHDANGFKIRSVKLPTIFWRNKRNHELL